MNYRQSYQLLNTALAAGLVIALLGAILDKPWIMTLGGAIAIAGVVQAVLFCRCPNCGESMETRGGLPAYCPSCGNKLEEK